MVSDIYLFSTIKSKMARHTQNSLNLLIPAFTRNEMNSKGMKDSKQDKR